jgi:phage-related protein
MEEEGGFVIAGLFKGITDAWKAITQFFSDAVTWFRNTFNNVAQIATNSWESIKQAWAVVARWFDSNIISPLTQAFTTFWSNLRDWASQAWSGITKVFGSAGQWFGKTFGDAWEKVKKVFSSGGKVFDGIKEGIVTSFKSIVNSLISGINRVIARPFEGLNAAIRKIRSVSVLGLYPFSGLSTVSVPSIPYLAQGAVLPANKPFMAVVGDQRHGTNVEAPLATIQEAVANVMGDQVAAMMAGFNALLAENQLLRQVVENVNLGDTTIGQAADRYNQKIAIMRGG